MEDNFWPPLPDWFWYPICFLYGSVVGSFLNVLIYRLPLNIPIGGKSYCPNCRNYLKPWQNVPIVGFLFLRGRCGFCRTPISFRYFAVELVTGCLWVALYHTVSRVHFITWIDFIFQALFASVLVAMVFIDLDYYIAPDELNLTGFLLGLGRDLTCLGLAYAGGRYVLNEFAPKYTYFGWLPHALVGALAYGAILFLVSFLGFIYYARGQKESLASVTRRFFTFEDLPEEMLTDEEKASIEEAKREAAEEMEKGPPPRLRFSPGFLSLLSGLSLLALLTPTGVQWQFPAGWPYVWAGLAFFVPLISFFLLTRQPDEAVGGVLRRFFSHNDLAAPPEHPTVHNDTLAASAPSGSGAAAMSAEEETDQFLVEAEQGKHGGMGLGDVKLALAIGAMLGPGMALLSLLFATLLGAVTGVIFTRMHGKSLRYGVPFVPFMAAGAILVMLFGNTLVEWYLIVSGVKKLPPSIPDPPRRTRRATPTPDPTRPYQGR